MRRFDLAGLAALILLSLSIPQAAHAQVDFSGETIEWIVPFREGGGADIWARFNAPYLSNYLPGNPEIVIRNNPGGGSTKGANQFAANAKPDGLMIMGTSASTQFPFLLGDSRVRYDYAKWQVLMVYSPGGVVYISSKFGVQNAAGLSELNKEILTYGSQGTTSIDLVPLLGFELLGLNVRPIFGIRGRSAGLLAFERGEATIDFQTSATFLQYSIPLVEQGKAIPLFSLGSLNENGELIRDPQFPDLPHFGEVYEMLHGGPPTGLAWESWFAFYTAAFGAQKLLVIPKDTPRNIIQTYQKALEEMQRDPDYIAKKPSALGAYDQVTGDTAERLYRLATDIPDGPKQWIKDWLRRKYGLNL